ncbi:hypothetical protein BLSMQ_0518 [Brevibacterium aurantiacum]|uniref:Uncharacterized protein n=1 Tax=Brevibacterium aurantiacum TaxID=273384 RepID=A0A1D7VZT3_BREAU|nr:hypothetical protein BLSMQ_0518 [Brevibacterium aurantiacum]
MFEKQSLLSPCLLGSDTSTVSTTPLSLHLQTIWPIAVADFTVKGGGGTEVDDRSGNVVSHVGE